MPDKILVLGGTGFFGRAVSHAILDRGYDLRMLVRDPGRAGAFRVRGAELVQGNATDAAVLEKACQGVAAVVDLVAVRRNRPQSYFDVNVEAPAKLGQVAKAAGVHKVVFVSAIGARPDAVSTYLASRYAGEQALIRTGTPHTIVRFSFLLGEDGGVVDDFQRAAEFGPVIVIPGDGQQHFQPIIRDDAARCVVDSIPRADLYGKTLELGGPEILTYEQLLDFFCRARDIKKPRLKMPISLLIPGAALMDVFMPDPLVTPDELKSLRAENVADALDVVVSTFNFRPASPSAWALQHWRTNRRAAVL